MYCNQIFSLIADNEIKNIVVCSNYDVASQLAKATLGDSAIAVDTTDFPVGIGDAYVNGIFYRDAVEIPRNPSERELIQQLQAQNEMLTECLLEMSELVYGS